MVLNGKIGRAIEGLKAGFVEKQRLQDCIGLFGMDPRPNTMAKYGADQSKL